MCEVLCVRQPVTNAKGVISQHNDYILNMYCLAIHKPSDPICEESFCLQLKPCVHCVLNSIITGHLYPHKASFSGPNMK